jgi:hypothetical protein
MLKSSAETAYTFLLCLLLPDENKQSITNNKKCLNYYHFTL